MSDYAVRLKALELAHAKHDDPEAAVVAAEKYRAFLDSDRDLLTATEWSQPTIRDVTKMSVEGPPVTGRHDGIELDVTVWRGDIQTGDSVALPKGLEVRYLDEADKSDPLNQQRVLMIRLSDNLRIDVALSDRAVTEQFATEREAMEEMVKAAIAYILQHAFDKAFKPVLRLVEPV
jgi:hypothetical protein